MVYFVYYLLLISLLIVLQLILTSQFPFKLSGKVLQVLVSIFLYHDFSVCNFVKGLQVSGHLHVSIYFTSFIDFVYIILCCPFWLNVKYFFFYS